MSDEKNERSLADHQIQALHFRSNEGRIRQAVTDTISIAKGIGTDDAYVSIPTRTFLAIGESLLIAYKTLKEETPLAEADRGNKEGSPLAADHGDQASGCDYSLPTTVDELGHWDTGDWFTD